MLVHLVSKLYKIHTNQERHPNLAVLQSYSEVDKMEPMIYSDTGSLEAVVLHD